jgi:hypothetical protein
LVHLLVGLAVPESKNDLNGAVSRCYPIFISLW